MIGFIRNTDPRILFLLIILSVLFVIDPGNTTQLLVDLFTVLVEILLWFVELVTLLYSN